MVPGTSFLRHGRSYLDKGNVKWDQTIPGKSWFIILKMYGPLELWLNKTWRPSEIELVE